MAEQRIVALQRKWRTASSWFVDSDREKQKSRPTNFKPSMGRIRWRRCQVPFFGHFKSDLQEIRYGRIWQEENNEAGEKSLQKQCFAYNLCERPFFARATLGART
jgi:hypothetical protein